MISLLAGAYLVFLALATRPIRRQEVIFRGDLVEFRVHRSMSSQKQRGAVVRCGEFTAQPIPVSNPLIRNIKLQITTTSGDHLIIVPAWFGRRREEFEDLLSQCQRHS